MKKIFLALALVFSLVTFAFAVAYFEQLSIGKDAVVAFTAAKIYHAGQYQQYAQEAKCTVTTGAINYTVDGTTPTTTATGVGHTANIGDVLTIAGYDNISSFQAIAVTSTSSTVTCTYFYNLAPVF